MFNYSQLYLLSSVIQWSFTGMGGVVVHYYSYYTILKHFPAIFSYKPPPPPKKKIQGVRVVSRRPLNLQFDPLNIHMQYVVCRDN